MDTNILTRLRSLHPVPDDAVEVDVRGNGESPVAETADDDADEQAMKPDRLVSDLIDYSVALGASDLFFAVDHKDVDVTLRHLGVIRQVARLPHDVGLRCMAFIRGAAGMKYAEKRHPQDGRWILHRPNGSSVDLRLNTVPTLYGECLAVRMLRRDSPLTKLQHLGLVESQLGEIERLLMSPSGLILVTGPTGSGKTTTLYAFLHALNNGRRKIHTIEDPVEYAVPGLRQTQVDDAYGAGFAEMLRAILRQGPDVIMIGEIRDAATAETAVLAANSGQLVLATLHAPVAAAAVHTMLGLGIAPYLLCTSLLGVVGQRLVRVLNPETRIALDLSMAPHTFDEVRRWLAPGEGQTVYTTPGPSANNEAYWYRGQTCAFELMLTSPTLRKMITEVQPASALAQAAIAEGMIDLRRAALIKVARGITSFDEMQSEIPSGTLWVDELPPVSNE
jgi:type II secretory ATPase GspE/PulE/Tfp pilus assembly ATPase PilB-like protein